MGEGEKFLVDEVVVISKICKNIVDTSPLWTFGKSSESLGAMQLHSPRKALEEKSETKTVSKVELKHTRAISLSTKDWIGPAPQLAVTKTEESILTSEMPNNTTSISLTTATIVSSQPIAEIKKNPSKEENQAEEESKTETKPLNIRLPPRRFSGESPSSPPRKISGDSPSSRIHRSPRKMAARQAEGLGEDLKHCKISFIIDGKKVKLTAAPTLMDISGNRHVLFALSLAEIKAKAIEEKPMTLVGP